MRRRERGKRSEEKREKRERGRGLSAVRFTTCAACGGRAAAGTRENGSRLYRPFQDSLIRNIR